MNARALPLLIALLLASSAYTAGYVGNEDFWWYLASGDRIVERGEIPERDPFLYTSSERSTWVTSGEVQRTWVTHSWLWTVALAELDRRFGLDGIALASALCVGAIAVLIFRRARLDRLGLVNALVVSLALAASASRFTPRADLASCLLMVVFLALLDRPSPLGWGRVAFLAALQALWSNLHGGYPLGLFVAFAFGSGDWLDARRAGPDAGSRARVSRTAPLLAVAPLLAIVSFATPPLGLERLRGALAFARALGASASGAASSPLLEWQPTYAAGLDASAWTHALFVAIGAASFAATRRPVRGARVAVFVGTAVLGASANRFVSVFALATAWLALGNLADLSPSLAERLRALRAPWLRAVHLTASALLAAALLATAAALWTSRRALDGDPARSGWSSVRPEFSAPGAAAYLREQRVPGPIFNEIALGGYLIDALRPTQLFIDTRNLSAPLLARYRAAIVGPEAWRRLDSEIGFRSVVLSNLTFTPLRLRRLLAHDPDWQLAFVDPQAAIFVRRDGRAAPPRIDASGHWGAGRAPFLPRDGPGPQAALRRYGRSLLLEYLRALADLEQPAALEAVASDALATAPADPALLAYRGYARMRQDRPLEAASDYAEVVRRVPGDLSARLNLARALARAGHPDEARAQLDAAAAIEPGNAALARLRARLDSRGPPR